MLASPGAVFGRGCTSPRVRASGAACYSSDCETARDDCQDTPGQLREEEAESCAHVPSRRRGPDHGPIGCGPRSMRNESKQLDEILAMLRSLLERSVETTRDRGQRDAAKKLLEDLRALQGDPFTVH